MKAQHDKLTMEDNLTVEKIKNYVDNEWSDLLPSFQLVIVKWLILELECAQLQLDNLGY